MTDNVIRLRPGGARDVVVASRLTAADIDAVTWLAEQATENDGVHPLSEHVTLHLRFGGDEQVRHVLVRVEGRLVGYAHLDTSDEVAGASAEFFVGPDERRRGHGTALLETVSHAAASRLRVWAHGDLPAAAALAVHAGLTRVRTLQQLRRPAGSAPKVPTLPAGVTIRPFRASDVPQWLQVNARAFAKHSEQGRWTHADMQLRMRESWFSEAGFLVAIRAVDQQMLGFAWTKVHGGQSSGDSGSHAHDPIGELYVIGVDPSAQGTGLGRGLVLAALVHLSSVGIDDVMLYVDADNTPAVRLYESLGFASSTTDVMYS